MPSSPVTTQALTSCAVASNVITCTATAALANGVPTTNTWVTTAGQVDGTFNGTFRVTSFNAGAKTVTGTFTHADGSTTGGTIGTASSAQVYNAWSGAGIQGGCIGGTDGAATWIDPYIEGGQGIGGICERLAAGTTVIGSNSDPVTSGDTTAAQPMWIHGGKIYGSTTFNQTRWRTRRCGRRFPATHGGPSERRDGSVHGGLCGCDRDGRARGRPATVTAATALEAGGFLVGRVTANDTGLPVLQSLGRQHRSRERHLHAAGGEVMALLLADASGATTGTWIMLAIAAAGFLLTWATSAKSQGRIEGTVSEALRGVGEKVDEHKKDVGAASTRCTTGSRR
jgi:hypothetical protein